MLETTASIRSDTPANKVDFASMSEDELASLYAGLHANTVRSGKLLADAADWSDYREFVDIGGGSGGLAIGLCQAYPALRGTVMELPSVAPTTREYISNAGIDDRVSVQEANLLEDPLPEGFDVAVAKNLFQVLSEDKCRLVARNIGAGLAPGATLFINGFICDDDRLGPEISVGYNLIFLNVYDDGTAYTEAQYREWLTDAGFTDIERKPFMMGTSLISARKI
jgi:cyclopropane fatty-acyl-phospholipid synthase-like methyltransferase